jgi:hypothetical protein
MDRVRRKREDRGINPSLALLYIRLYLANFFLGVFVERVMSAHIFMMARFLMPGEVEAEANQEGEDLEEGVLINWKLSSLMLMQL